MRRRQKRSIGEVTPEWAGLALNKPIPSSERNGIALLPVKVPATVATFELVNQLRDDEL
jgi:hypothetical protein